MTDHVKDQLCARIEELESEKMELNAQLDELQEERDALSAKVEAIKAEAKDWKACAQNWEANAKQWDDDWHTVKKERDALAAHVERWSEWLARDPEDDEGSWMDDGWEIHASSPEASLARLKAQWQAEVLDSLESRIKPLRQTDNGAQGKGYNLALEDCLAAIDMVRRQVEGGV